MAVYATGKSSAAAQAEHARQIKKRIQEAQDHADRTVNEIKGSAERTRESLTKQTEEEQVRHENQLAKQRLENYERLLEQKREHLREERRLKREGDKRKAELSRFYEDETSRVRIQGDQELKRLRARQHRQGLSENRVANMQRDVNLSNHQLRMKAEQDKHKRQIDDLKKLDQLEYDRMRTNLGQARVKTQTDLNRNYKSLLDHASGLIRNLNQEAATQLHELRADSARKLIAYDERNEDPFYQMVDFGAEFEELDDAYVLKAKIPFHEQDNVTISVKGNQLVLSGKRRNHEVLNGEPGNTKSTSSFQSYTQTFPINVPVEPRALFKQFEDETLTVHVPKKSHFTSNDIQRPSRQKPEGVALTRPRFPEKLPIDPEEKPEKPDPSDLNKPLA